MRATTTALAAWVALGGCGAQPAPVTTVQQAALAPASVSVLVQPIIRGPLGTPPSLSGTAEPWESTRVTAETAGLIVERRVDNGQQVQGGEILFRLDASRQALAIAQAEVAVRKAENDVAWLRSDVARKVALADKNAVTALERDAAQYRLRTAEIALESAKVQLKTARRQWRDTIVRAPHAGIVHSRTVGVGAHVGPQTPLCEIVDLSRVRVRAGVRADLAARLKSGQDITVHAPDLGGLTVAGRLRSIAPRADPRSGLFALEVEAENPEQALRAGMVVQVELDRREPRPVQLLAPREAIVTRNGEKAVFVVEDGVAHHVPVRTGAHDERYIALHEGPPAGARVAISALNAITDGVRVLAEEHHPEHLGAPQRSPATDEPGRAPPL